MRSLSFLRSCPLAAFLLLMMGLIVLASGCGASHTYRRAYTVGAVTKEFVTTEHQHYSEALQARLATCDPDRNPDAAVRTKRDFDECMGRWFRSDRAETVAVALGTYHAAAEVLTTVLLRETATPDEIRRAQLALVRAARDLIALFPEGKRVLDKYDMLVPG